MIREREHRKDEIADELQPIVEEAQKRIEELGLSPRPVRYWINHNDEVNQLAAYGGFQKRYPHWRWGMKYDKQRKQGEYQGGKIFEMVVNNDPCHAYLQMSNDDVDQKAVITHVEAHSDFFANNKWFQDSPQAVEMLSRHAEKIRSYMEDPDIDREAVEKWIDNILCLQDTIDQYSEYVFRQKVDETSNNDKSTERTLENLNIDEEIEDAVFEDDFFEEPQELEYIVDTTIDDILGFLISEGKQYNEKRGEAVEYEEWQIDILDILREEAYYFAPQKMTKIMNEGFSSYIESLIMTDEVFAETEEIVDYADQHSKVIQSRGINPYRLGKALWEHVENTVNRREVVDKLLRIDGITPNNFHREIDFEFVFEVLYAGKDDSDVIERNYSLTRPHNKGFIQDISVSELQKMNRYIVEQDRYTSSEEALVDVDFHKGWEEIKEIRETHNDVMFIDEFLTQEFVDAEDYFTYEYRIADEENQIASRDVEDVKKKLLLQLTNFGKPKVEVVTGNWNNAGELLLLHRYNGVVMEYNKIHSVLERMYEMWGRPVNLATVGKDIADEELDYAYTEGVEPLPEEIPVIITYDGESIDEKRVKNSRLKGELQAEEIDYDTKPESWL